MADLQNVGGSQLSQLHTKYTKDLLKYYQEVGTAEGKVLGLFDKPGK